MAEICRSHDVDLRAAALQFAAAHPVVAAVIPGAKTPDKVRLNAELMSRPIPQGFWREMKERGLLPAHAPVPGQAEPRRRSA